MIRADTIPIPSPDDATLVVEAPGDGPGYWAGGPSAALDDNGIFWLAYRLRRPAGAGRGYANAIARSSDGVGFETVALVNREQFECDSLERPALVALPDGSWRLYVSCATPGSHHWRVDALDAADPSQFPSAPVRTILPGDRISLAVKDPVIKVIDGRWHMWSCCHPLDLPDDTDRMFTEYSTSDDGLQWTSHGRALVGTAGQWDQRGARVTDVIRRHGRWFAYYDGRANQEDNAEERTGIAVGNDPGHLSAEGHVIIGGGPKGDWSLRYLSTIDLPDGGRRLYYETRRRDGAHDLRTEYVPPSR
jgi:hypothetical protein